MKKAILAMVLLIGVFAMAQREGKSNRGEMKDLTPEQMATLQTKKMTLALDLSEAQQKQIQALNFENAKTRKAKMEERKVKKEADEAKKPTAEERYAMQNARLDARIAQKAKLKEILSQEQYDKWEKMAYRRGKHRKGKGKKGEGRKGLKKEGRE